MKIDKKIKGASKELLDLISPIREAVSGIVTKEELSDEELLFTQNELRRLSREIKRTQKRSAAEANVEPVKEEA